ncbi:unnamed protein product [Caenorhabditis angaria]|uniref:VWFA domain-containing protein n=1 Tax=Caenorhabditis angaria TaxID=860376 RepID=A0A9P1IBZ6_9PELO|nr:unnamed protein product [Caenorhabditis angaria]
MKSIIFFIALLIVGTRSQTASPSAYVDRECGQNLQTLWLDVVVVVDNSAGMTNTGLTQVASNIATVFLNGTQIGSNYTDPRSTRVSLVTYNSDAAITADLNTYQSIDDLMGGAFGALGAASPNTESTLQRGIAAAEQVLNNGRQGVRTNYKQAVIIYASEYSGTGEKDPKPAADRLKESGVQIITVAFNQDGNQALLAKLSEIASPGYNFTSLDTNIVGEIQGALLQINCFCPDLWVQYKADFNDRAAYKYGVCVRSAGLQSAWTPAKFACQNFAKTGFLVSEFSQQKHDFVFALVQNDPTVTAPFMYHIGLSKINGVWSWQQPAGQSVLPLQGYSKWNPGYATSVSSDTAVLNSQTGTNLDAGWQNISPYTVSKNYVCESNSCDTDNYCA